MGTFFVDAETDGLYGMFLSVAAVVLDENGSETDVYYGVIRNPETYVTSDWVRENVLPFLNDNVRSDEDLYDSESALIDSFYSFYLSHSECNVIADVPYPVEARLFIKAVEHDLQERTCKAPFPLMDLSSMLYAKGYSPLTERETVADCSGLRHHNALDDVRMSIRVWKNLKGAAVSQENRKICSYHTFILPFTWKMPGVSQDEEYTALRAVFEGNPFWESTNLQDEMNILSKPDLKTDSELLGFYKEYQYFYPYVRKSAYGYEDDICANYLLSASRNNGEYHIIKDIEKEKTLIHKHYLLNINAIRVRLVNTGVGLFIMECENYGKDADGNDQSSIDDIKNINDYGRRITLPFINRSSNISADRLEVHIPDLGDFIDDFKSFIADICNGGKEKAGRICLNHMCDFIKELLSYKSGYRFVSHPAVEKNSIQVCPALDDRMYVAYAVCAEDFVNEATKQDSDGHYAYLTNDEISSSLYEIAYADCAGNCSCPDRKMRLDLIDKALYKRWLPTGTFHFITAMGFGMVSSAEIGGNYGYLYENMIVCYYRMVYSAVIQRASIVKFSSRTTDIARHFAANGRRLRRQDIRSIMSLQERHSAFNSQLLFPEVSSEQQAIEMYDMLKDAFMIEEENKKIDEKLNSLYEISDTDLNIRVNTSIGVLTWLSIILSAGALLYSILFASDVVVQQRGYSVFPGFPGSIETSIWIFLIVLVVLSVLAFILIRFHNRRR